MKIRTVFGILFFIAYFALCLAIASIIWTCISLLLSAFVLALGVSGGGTKRYSPFGDYYWTEPKIASDTAISLFLTSFLICTSIPMISSLGFLVSAIIFLIGLACAITLGWGIGKSRARVISTKRKLDCNAPTSEREKNTRISKSKLNPKRGEHAGICPKCGSPLKWRRALLTGELYRGCTNYQGGCRYQERSYKRTPIGKEKKGNNLTGEVESFQYKLIEEPFCKICGNPNVQTQNCTWHRNLYGFNRIHVMGKYFPSSIVTHDLLSKHILKMKNEREYAKPLGEALALFVKQFHQELLRYSLIVPVPLHSQEFGKRGYNQALELAKVVGRILRIPVQHVLRKTEVVNMRPLSWIERREAVKGLYEVIQPRRHQIYNKDIILIDDVVTSGFTVSECSDVLVRTGAKKVDVLALARTMMEVKE